MTNLPEGQGGTAVREAHLRDYWEVVWSGRRTVTAVFLVVCTAVAVWTLLQTPVYRATAVVEVQPKATRLTPGQDVSGLGAAGYGWFAEEKYHNTQVEIIRSRDVAERVVRTLGLAQHPQFAEASDPVEAFRGMIQVLPQRDTGLIDISVEGSNPEWAAEWTNAVAHAYVDRNLEQSRKRVEDAFRTIQDSLTNLRATLRQADSDRFKVLSDEKIFNPESEQEVVGQKLSTYNEDLAGTRIKISRLRASLNKVRELQDSGGDPMSLPELAQDTVLQGLNRDRIKLEQQIESAKVTLRPGHPAFEEKLGELDKVRQAIRDRIVQILGKLETEHNLAAQHEQYLKKQIAKAESEAFDLGKATSKYDIYRADAETVRGIYDLISKTMNEVRLSTQLITNNVSVLDEAIVPQYPIKPRKKLDLIAGAMLGLFLGIGTVFFLDYLDNTFRTPEDVEKYLGLNVLAVIPRIREGKVESHAVKESYQSLRTSVIFSSMNRERRVILVTSGAAQEGKSSTVANLARTLASAGDRVLVVDCDLRRPTQNHQFGINRDRGLTNYLSAPLSETDWTPYVQKTDGPTLDVIPSGPIPPSPPDLLGSARFADLLRRLKDSYDWVLLDSPPASSLTDASLLASVADMVVIVIKHNHGVRDVVIRSVQQLRNVNEHIAGAVLNDVDISRAYGKDYYYAGYYYESDDGSRKRRHRKGKKTAGEPEKGVSAGV